MMKNNCQVDMHIHTTASDGTWTPEEVLDIVIENNIGLFSITDHDTIEGSLKLINKIPNDIHYIIGTQISSTYNGEEYHITAYDFDYKNSELNELLKFNQLQRKEFNTKIIKYLKEVDKMRDITDYFSYKYDRKRGGWESLNYLIDKNIVKDLGEYFRILNLSNERLIFKHPKEVIDVIRAAGGYSFLAHPSGYRKGAEISIEVLKEWKDYGISGIECYSPYLKDIEDANYYVDFCEDNNLMISAGSDCHGEFNSRTIGIPKVNLDKVKLDFIKGEYRGYC